MPTGPLLLNWTPTQIGYRFERIATQSIPTGADTQIIFDTDIFKIGLAVTPGGTVTMPSTMPNMLALITAGFVAASGTTWIMNIEKNLTPIARSSFPGVSGTISVVTTLQDADIVIVTVRHAEVGSVLIGGGSGLTWCGVIFPFSQ